MNVVVGHSRSSEMALFDRPYTNKVSIIWYYFCNITIFAAYMSASDLETSFNFVRPYDNSHAYFRFLCKDILANISSTFGGVVV